MWLACLIASIGVLALSGIIFLIISKCNFENKHRLKLFNIVLVGVFVSGMIMYYPLYYVFEEATALGVCKSIMLSFYKSMQMFGGGGDYGVVVDGLEFCSGRLHSLYQMWALTIFIFAPILTFGFVISLFKNLSAYVKYIFSFFKDTYVFTELNENSLALARDIKEKHKKAAIAFTNISLENGEVSSEFIEEASGLKAICFKKDALVIDFKKHSKTKSIIFFAISKNETKNLDHSLKLIGQYGSRDNTGLYTFSTSNDSEILLSSAKKGKMKVRRINEVQSLLNRVLYENGEVIFESAKQNDNGTKDISAVIVGLGRHGKEMLKALSWFGQMDGYNLEINAFDQDAMAEEKFTALAPELMSNKYNGVAIDGEAQYKIHIHSGIKVDTLSFVKEINKIKNATYVLVALGNDDANINAAINLRMCFERMGIKPIIQAIVYNSWQKQALEGLKNFKGEEYKIEFIGDVESSYSHDVIINSNLEKEALARHLKWGEESTFWNSEYNYRSSVASAIHMRARVKCGIPGANKTTENLTPEEQHIIEVLEHKRWNAYMRSEGYVFSGSSDPSSRNDLAKMHNDLVDYEALSEDEKRKDSSVGAR